MVDEPVKRKKRAGPRAMLVILGLLLAFAAFVVASRWGANIKLEAIRERGLPVTPVELDKWYTAVPEKENAALKYVKAAEEFVEPTQKLDPNVLGKELIPGEPMWPELAEAVNLHVADNETVLRIMAEGAQLSASRYPVELSKGFDALLPHLAKVKRMAQLSKWAAIQASEAGRPGEALDVLFSGFAVAASLEQEPLVISQLVRIAAHIFVMNGLEHVASAHPLNETDLARFSQELARAETKSREGIHRALVGERAAALPVFEMSYKELNTLGGGDGSGVFGSDDPLRELWNMVTFETRRVTGLRSKDLDFYLMIMGEWESAVQKDFPEMLRETAATTRKMDSMMGGGNFGRYAVSGMILPALEKVAEKGAFDVARIRCARLALAIEMYRLRHDGKLPTLEQLVPAFIDEIPRDPFDDEPLELEVYDEKDFRVTAVAATLKSNSTRSPQNRIDVKFSVAR